MSERSGSSGARDSAIGFSASPAMKLSLVSSGDGVCRVACSGELTILDVAGADSLEALLGADGFGHTVLLDLGRTTFLDTAAVGWLIGLHKKFQQAGGRLILHSVPPLIDQMFRLLKLPAVLHVAGDEAAARALAEG
jgi:anti-anti-sigma factor